MTKLYSMDQHNFAIRQPFKISWKDTDINPRWCHVGYVDGFGEILEYLSSWKTSLTIEKLFEIFIDRGASKHVILFLDEEGDIAQEIKIEKE